MKTINNKYEFSCEDKQFIDFFNQHGWVVVKNVFSNNKISLLQSQYKEMKSEYADEAGIAITDYEDEITQWRNLWLRFHDHPIDVRKWNNGGQNAEN